MSHLNSYLVEGFVTKHTDLTVSPRGIAHFSFTVASLRSYKDNNYVIEDTSFFPVDVFHALAEGEAKTIATGAFVRVVGRLRQIRYRNETGRLVSEIRIIGEHVEHHPSKDLPNTAALPDETIPSL